MLRIGIDTGSGGIHGPLFQDRSFEYIPIPDKYDIDSRTYGNTTGRTSRKLYEYFPKTRQKKVEHKSMHFDPEFITFTYGDPTTPKAGLRHLEKGDMLIFYCGLKGWDFQSDPALYLMGYFEIETAGKADKFSLRDIKEYFAENFHVRHQSIFKRQINDLVLVKGSEKSRLLEKAVLMSEVGKNRAGKPIKVLSSKMQNIFGNFSGKISFQRSPTRWVAPPNVDKAAKFMRSLP